MSWFDSLPLGLNRDRPVIPPPGHGDISRCSLDLEAVDKPNPSSFGQENPIPIQLETLRVSKGIDALAFFLEPGKPLRILLILFDHRSLFICLAYLCSFNCTLVYGEKQRDSNRKNQHFQYARPSGLCDQIAEYQLRPCRPGLKVLALRRVFVPAATGVVHGYHVVTARYACCGSCWMRKRQRFSRPQSRSDN
jgi:hypothetical protein